MKKALAIPLSALCISLSAQDTEPPGKLEFSGYIDFYYAYYSDEIEQSSFQKFATVAPRSNEFSLDIAQVSMNYTSDKLRTHATLHYGDIPSSSWSSAFNFVQQAYIGYRVSKDVWVDAGLFTTHIGTEALLPKDNKLSTLALGTYHEPYFQSGIMVKYDPGKRFALSLHLLNGYNNFLDNNRSKSVGLYTRYAFSEKAAVSYSNCLGRETLTRDTRFYNNMVITVVPLKNATLIVGGDYGIQKGVSMHSAMGIFRYNWSESFSSTARVELFDDPNGFLSGVFPHTDDPLQQSGLTARGITLGVEYKPTPNSYVRCESRSLTSSGKLQLFLSDGQATSQRTELVFTTGIWF